MFGHARSARTFRLGAVLSLALCGAGCASFSPDGGISAVNAIVASALRDDAVKVDTDEAAAEVSARTSVLLNSTLSAGAAVRVVVDPVCHG